MPRRPLFILAAAALVLTTAGPALAACGSTQVFQVGNLSGDPEKDTFALLCGPAGGERTSALTSSARNEIVQVGAITGEAEKDTLGYLQTPVVQ
jgi:hypothetical protein